MGKGKGGKKRGQKTAGKNQQQADPPLPPDNSEKHEVAPAAGNAAEQKPDPRQPRPPATRAEWTIAAFTVVLTGVAATQISVLLNLLMPHLLRGRHPSNT